MSLHGQSGQKSFAIIPADLQKAAGGSRERKTRGYGGRFALRPPDSIVLLACHGSTVCVSYCAI